jgi:ribosomal protein S4E
MFVFSGISQSEFETVIPKQENAYVLIVSGKHKGQVIILSTRFIETDFLMIKD